MSLLLPRPLAVVIPALGQMSPFAQIFTAEVHPLVEASLHVVNHGTKKRPHFARSAFAFSRAFICRSAQLKSPAEGLRKSHQTSLPPHAVSTTQRLWYAAFLGQSHTGPIILHSPPPVQRSRVFALRSPGHTTVIVNGLVGHGEPVPLCLDWPAMM